MERITEYVHVTFFVWYKNTMNRLGIEAGKGSHGLVRVTPGAEAIKH